MIHRPRGMDADTYLQIWNAGHAARAIPNTRCPYDPHEQPGHYRAWIKGHQAAVFGEVTVKSETPPDSR